MSADGMVAVIPARGLVNGKTRLAGELPPEARAALTRRMLRGVVQAALDSGVLAAVTVVSPDPAALALVTGIDDRVVSLVQDAASPGLDAAVAVGRDWAVDRGAVGLLVLFGDLPLLTGDDVRRLVAHDAPVVLAPDHHGTGTNALLLRLAPAADGSSAFRFQYGVGSYARHLDEAHRLGLRVATNRAPGTAFDLDTPADLRSLLAAGTWDPGSDAGPTDGMAPCIGAAHVPPGEGVP